MVGVLIVDDEALARMRIKSLIDWEKEGYCILGEAENGKSGLDFIIREKPELVITDIKMPVMDGLEMIYHARKEYDAPRYIVLSSYEEFGLLKTAMQYGVTEYVLKLELTPDILKKTLESQRDLLRQEQSARETAPAHHAARGLRRILAGYDVEEELARSLRRASPGIVLERLSCIAVRFTPLNKYPAFSPEEYRTIETAAVSIVGDITKPYFRGISFLADTGLCLFVYTPTPEGAAREMCGVIIQMLRDSLNLTAAVGIASITDRLAEINRIMIEAVRATEAIFFRGYGIIVYSADLDADVSAVKAPAGYAWAEPLRHALELRQADKIRTLFQDIRRILSAPPPHRISRPEAFNLCFSLGGITLSVLKTDAPDNRLFNEDLYAVIGCIETLTELQEWLRSFELKILGFLQSLPEKTYDDHIIIRAKRYIAEHWGQPISLNEAANHLAISAGYLSSLFKRKTGVGFVEYVTKVKIDEARKLLPSGRYKIYEVADMVGYEDTGYFIKTFHKVTGMTPKEFIAQHI